MRRVPLDNKDREYLGFFQMKSKKREERGGGEGVLSEKHETSLQKVRTSGEGGERVLSEKHETSLQKVRTSGAG